MKSKYFGPIKWLGGIAIILFAFALIFPIISNAVFSEETRKAVLINAVPFFSTFVGILLLFALLIVLTAKRYNGKVPGRTYHSIEQTLIAGIGVSVACLFQPWSNVPYKYGFTLLLLSTLGFILWSHVIPRSMIAVEASQGLTLPQRIASVISGIFVGIFFSMDTFNMRLLFYRLNIDTLIQAVHGFFLFVVSIFGFFVWIQTFNSPLDNRLPSLGPKQNMIGAVSGLIVGVVIVLLLVSVAAPTPPYGLRDRLWNSYNDERKAEIASAATSDFNSVETPFIIIFSLFPAAIIYFAMREVAAERRPTEVMQTVAAAGRV